jgi:hypothetical protein
MKSKERTSRLAGQGTPAPAAFEWSASVTRSSIDFMNVAGAPSGCNCDCSGYVRKDDKLPHPQKKR